MYLRCPSAKMVSNASEDFPDPDTPVITTSLSRGISTSSDLRLCSAAPRTLISRESDKPRMIGKKFQSRKVQNPNRSNQRNHPRAGLTDMDIGVRTRSSDLAPLEEQNGQAERRENLKRSVKHGHSEVAQRNLVLLGDRIGEPQHLEIGKDGRSHPVGRPDRLFVAQRHL